MIDVGGGGGDTLPLISVIGLIPASMAMTTTSASAPDQPNRFTCGIAAAGISPIVVALLDRAVERVALADVAGLHAPLQPGHALRRGAVREVALRHLPARQRIVADLRWPR